MSSYGLNLFIFYLNTKTFLAVIELGGLGTFLKNTLLSGGRFIFIALFNLQKWIVLHWAVKLAAALQVFNLEHFLVDFFDVGLFPDALLSHSLL